MKHAPTQAQIDAAQEWLANLPDHPAYRAGLLEYPPHGQYAIAKLCAGFALSVHRELIDALEVAATYIRVPMAQRTDETLKRINAALALAKENAHAKD